MEYRSRKKWKTSAIGSHLVYPDYWARKCARGERCAEIRGALDQTPFRTTATDSQAREPIRSQLLVDYVKRGTNDGSGDTQK